MELKLKITWFRIRIRYSRSPMENQLQRFHFIKMRLCLMKRQFLNSTTIISANGQLWKQLQMSRGESHFSVFILVMTNSIRLSGTILASRVTWINLQQSFWDNKTSWGQLWEKRITTTINLLTPQSKKFHMQRKSVCPRLRNREVELSSNNIRASRMS